MAILRMGFRLDRPNLVETIPIKEVEQKDVIYFIEDHIVSCFGILQTLTIDRGTMFIGKKMVQYVELRNIKLLASTPYYAQANGQVEAINKILIKKHIDHKPQNWHETLNQVLWAY
ncbi:uncharacterized protein [Cicer arietinum]|uniref:Uncharacterized protein LOC105852722 n=1 Tax=Cicer arietinum TaxID=3827 RepID=A0A1S3EFZ9_CICAR|nr:uncharacterized protein LOC105852722 [Cicer arietinum]